MRKFLCNVSPYSKASLFLVQIGYITFLNPPNSQRSHNRSHRNGNMVNLPNTRIIRAVQILDSFNSATIPPSAKAPNQHHFTWASKASCCSVNEFRMEKFLNASKSSKIANERTIQAVLPIRSVRSSAKAYNSTTLAYPAGTIKITRYRWMEDSVGILNEDFSKKPFTSPSRIIRTTRTDTPNRFQDEKACHSNLRGKMRGLANRMTRWSSFRRFVMITIPDQSYSWAPI